MRDSSPLRRFGERPVKQPLKPCLLLSNVTTRQFSFLEVLKFCPFYFIFYSSPGSFFFSFFFLFFFLYFFFYRGQAISVVILTEERGGGVQNPSIDSHIFGDRSFDQGLLSLTFHHLKPCFLEACLVPSELQCQLSSALSHTLSCCNSLPRSVLLHRRIASDRPPRCNVANGILEIPTRGEGV